jgi:outer membrane receptor protein involved in Fe transport
MSVKSKTTNKKKSLLTGASVLAAAAAALSGVPAMAQDAEEEEAIVVTGTRLVRQDFEAISPITTVGSEQLELTATLTTDSLLNELPQIVPGNTRTSNNAAGEAFATVDLRGLGVQRTLVLVNGERYPASSTTGAVDLNTIPTSLISRIEVVTGGASAVYGSDAVAGVVNFVLKDDYEGAEVNLTYGAELETGNAAEFEINGLVGGNFANGRGNMTAYASYYNREGVFQSEYDYSRVSAAACYDPSVEPSYFVCDSVEEAIANGWTASANLPGGSGTPPWGWITNSAAGRGPDGFFGTADDTGNPFGGLPTGGLAGPDGILGTADDVPVFGGPNRLSAVLPGQFGAANTDCNAATAGVPVNTGNLSFNDAGQLTPRFVGGYCRIPQRSAGSSRYNYAPDNFLVIPSERIALTTNGHYDISDDVTLSVLMNYTNSRTEVQLAPTPATGLTVVLTPTMRNLIQRGVDGIDGNADDHDDLWAALQTRPNAYAPFTMDRRTTEIGTRNAYNENNAFFALISLDGALGENWDWNLSGSYGQSHFLQRQINSANKSGLLAGLSGCRALTAGADGILNTADDGEAAIPGLLGTSQYPCVPIDIFGPNTMNQAMVDYLRTTTFQDTIIEENRLGGYLRGDLFELPAGPVATVFGFEYRDTFMGFTVDNEQRLGNIYGFNAIQDREGTVDVYELYTEVAVPLASDSPFAHYLGLEAGYRISNYSTVGEVDAYKIGGEWAPTEWLRFRAIFNSATRAPSVFELFRAGDQGFGPYTDVCAIAANQAACIAAPGTAAINPGVYPGFAANNSQVQQFAFGNPNLKAETAETLTYGFVFQPDWFPIGDFRATVDYFDIEITDVIAARGVQFWQNDCYVNANLNGGCARIVRDPITGQISSINTGVANFADQRTKGWDMQFEWSVPVGPGQLTINELYSILDSWVLNGTDYSGATSAGPGSAFPDYKSVLSVSYSVGDWTLFGRWSYTPEMNSFGIGCVNPGGPVFGCATATDPGTGFDIGQTPEASYFDLSAGDHKLRCAIVGSLFDGSGF